MKIDYAVPLPDKPHILHVGLRFATPRGDEILETPVRRSMWESLPNAAARLAYAQEAAEYHHPRGSRGLEKRATRRATWDADDLAAEQAKWVARQVGKEGNLALVEVTHGGLSVQVWVPLKSVDPEAVIKAAWQAEWDKHQAEQRALAAFNIG